MCNVIDLRLGDLLLIKGTDWISRTIEDVERSPYSHVGGAVNDFELIEAEGFRKTGYKVISAYEGHADVFRCDSASSIQLQVMQELAKWNVGGRYDYFLLLVEFIRYVSGLMLPYREPQRVRICSVLWAKIYRDAGIDLCPGIKYPSPADVAQSKLLRKIGSI